MRGYIKVCVVRTQGAYGYNDKADEILISKDKIESIRFTVYSPRRGRYGVNICITTTNNIYILAKSKNDGVGLWDSKEEAEEYVKGLFIENIESGL